MREDKSAPEAQLRLEWVYGYRGHQCRNNVYEMKSGHVVYFVAGVGIVMDPVARQQRFYLGHGDDIISLAPHPNGDLVATGEVGKSPKICIWSTSTLETTSILQGSHERGVSGVNFGGPEAKLLVSVGLEDSHQIVVWDWQKGIALASIKGHGDRVFDVQFTPFDDFSLASCGVKHMKFWSLSGNTLTGKRGIFGKAGELQTQLCLAFGPDGATYSGALNGDIYKWKGNNLASTIPRAHAGAVYTIDMCREGYATAGKDGVVRLWDKVFAPITSLDLKKANQAPTHGLVIRSVCWRAENILVGTKAGDIFLVNVHDKKNLVRITEGHAEGELWGLATDAKRNRMYTASDDRTVRIWDMDKHELIRMRELKQDARSVCASPDGEFVAVGLKDGSFMVLKGSDLSEVHTIRNRQEVLHEMKFSPDGSLLAVGSNDNFVDIYSVPDDFKRVGECRGASSYITHLDFSEDAKYLQINSGAGEHLYHALPTGKRVTNQAEIDAIKWHTWTSVLGEPVNGIWGKYMKTDDINACEAYGNAVVTGDDFGKVKVFRYPCSRRGAKSRAYPGHSAHVTNIRFSHDKKRVVSTGGADLAIFQWMFLPGGVCEIDEQELPAATHIDSHDEDDSDSEASNVDEVDSDIEREAQTNYDREITKEDLAELHTLAKMEIKASNVPRAPAPDYGVRLAFVHGYRGYDCRNNLFITPAGDYVYHVAAVGVVYTPSTHEQRFFNLHTDDILSLCLHPAGDVAATGQVGKNPCINLWDVNTMLPVAVLKDAHERGICALDFSSDGKRLASVGLDDDHTIVVWDWKKGIPLATTRGHKDKIFVIRWHPMADNELVTVGVKHIKFWTQCGGGFTSKRGIFGKAGKLDTMLSLAFGQEGISFSGATNGMVYEWHGNQLARVIEAHEGAVFSMFTLEKGFVTGGKDGNVGLWDGTFSRCLKKYTISKADLLPESPPLMHDRPTIRAVCLAQGKIVAGTANGEVVEVDKAGPIKVVVQGHGKGELWGLATHPTTYRFATVSDDKTLRVWDAEANACLNLKKLKKEGRSVAFSPDGRALAVGMKDGSFVVVDAESLKEIAKFHHRKEEVSDLKFSPNGKFLAVGSHDNMVDIYDVMNSKRVGVCKGASSYITHVDWEADGKLLLTNSGAKELLFFEAPRATRQPLPDDIVTKMTWASWTGVLGKACTGIWPPGSDITDVNTSHRSHDGELLATGDDFGLVKIFTWPAKGKFSKFKKYLGHSAHVTCVRWVFDDSRLISVGGADTSIMVWKNAAIADSAQRRKSVIVGAAGDSDDSDTDEEEDGYDSDVEHEAKIDYDEIAYMTPLRDTGAVKPHMREEEKDGDRPRVSRKTGPKTKVLSKSSTGSKKPKQSLELEFVHGYRGYDSRDNVRYTSNGNIVYHAAGACIVFDPVKRLQSYYLEHGDDIISLDVNPNPKMSNFVATGQVGKVPTIHVWDSTTLQTLSIIKGPHKKAVCSVSFSPSGKLLASVAADDACSFAIHKWSTGTCLASKDVKNCARIFVVKFRPDSENQLVTCGVKHIRFWTHAGSQLIGKRGIVGRDRKMQTQLSIAFGPPGITFSGSMSGEIFAWNDNQLVQIISHEQGAHVGPVFTMHTVFNPKHGNTIISGGKDGRVKIWNGDMSSHKTCEMAEGDVVRSVFQGPDGKLLVGTRESDIYEIGKDTKPVAIMHGHSEGQLWGLAVHPTKEWFATGSDDKTIRLWTLDGHRQLCKRSIKEKCRSLCFSPDGDLMAAGMENGSFLLLRTKDLDVIREERDRRSAIQDIKFSPCGTMLGVGSDDAWIDIYSVVEESVKRIGFCKNLGSFVSHFDWSTDSAMIQVNTGNYEHLFYKVPSGTVASKESIEKRTWATWTSVLGDNVIGIWPKNAEKADVNCCNISPNGMLCATGDDFGYVRLYQYPVTEKFAKHQRYQGHSDDILNVRFSASGNYLMSVGGNDSCIFVWRVVTAE